jgi:hypothetical protein
MGMRFQALAAGLVLTGSFIHAQRMLESSQSGAPILLNGDMSVLEAGEPRHDLECTVTPDKAALGFDLKFHAGFTISVPLKELAGPGDLLSVLFRVTPKHAQGMPVYFSEQFRVPALQETGGSATLTGAFDLGEGTYHVDWLMHDFEGRFCSSYWDVDATLSAKDKQVAMALPAWSVSRAEDENFQPEAPVMRTQDAPLNVKVLMNFAPQDQDSVSVDPIDAGALVSILRNLARNPQIGTFSLVTFNVQQQRVLYRQGASDHIDFPAMGDALKSLQMGTVNVHRLEHKDGATEFLSNLIRDETTVKNGQQPPDALIFVAPKTLIDSSVPQDDLKQIGDPPFPVFYMNYTRDPVAAPWKDAISRAVKFLKGREYSISGPRDLWNAVSEVVSRIAQTKQARETAGEDAKR